MPLQKARGGHLAEVLATPDLEPAADSTDLPKAVQEPPAPVAEKPKKAAAPKPVVQKAAAPAAPSTPADESEATPKPYVRPSHSGTVNCGWKWPGDDVRAVRAIVADRDEEYADAMRAATGLRGWGLSVSGVIIGAWNFAAPHLDEWLPTCPGDGRATKVSTADYQRIQASLPEDLERLLRRTARQRGLDYEAAGGQGLTLVGLVIGAVRYALPHIDEWLLQIPNDGRRLKPAPADGRLKQNR